MKLWHYIINKNGTIRLNAQIHHNAISMLCESALKGTCHLFYMFYSRNSQFPFQTLKVTRRKKSLISGLKLRTWSTDSVVKTLKLCCSISFQSKYFKWIKKFHYRPEQALGVPEAPRIEDNRHKKVVRLSALRTGRIYPQKIFLALISVGDRSSTMVKLMCYKSEGRWFDPSRCQWIFHWHKSFRSHYGSGVDSASNRNKYQEYFLGVKAAGA